ncbi:MAG: T9SS C-terminal target domain-containing protein [Methylococcus sp.]|nr:MAG: T9SS C-terminal target domain-containing protein [Methylococcus sp.]
MSNSTLLMQSDSVLQNQTMTGGMTGSNKFWHLTVNKPSTAGGNTVLLNNDIDNFGDFNLGTSATYAGGILNANGKHHRVGGHFNVRYASLPFAVYNAAGSTLEFNGAAAQNYFNPGTLHNVLLNHTGTGVTLGNSTVTDWMTVAGVLTFNQGKMITGANRVNVINTAPASVTAGNAASFVDGNLKRAFAPSGGSYDFPVGTLLRGYQRINYNFGSVNDRLNATVWFSNSAPATPAPFLGPECVTALYDQAPLNHGTWYAQTTPSTGSALYSVTAHNSNYTNAMSGYTVMVKHNTAAWGLEGSCLAASPITAVQRSGLSMMSATSQFAIAQALSPLPVELLSFTAKAHQKFIRLNWITGSEVNNHGFEIHRSSSPPEFQYLGWRPGAGTTSQETRYEFDDFDAKPGVLYYYKLRQIDFDGQTEWSENVAARIGESGFILSALPNPYSGFSNISIQVEKSSEVKLEVFSKLGQLVEVLHDGHLEDGFHTYEFGASKLGYPAGVYIIKATVDGQPSYLRLIETD